MVAVLGANGTLGRGVVQALLESGRAVVAVADDRRELAALSAANPGTDLTALSASLTGDAEAAQLARTLRGLNRAIDAVVVAPTEVSGRGRLLDHPTHRLGRALEQALLPQLAVARQLLPLLGEAGRGGRYLLVVGPGSELPWAGYGYRSVTAAALRMLAQVLHDEARSLEVRVQVLTIDSPVSGEPRSPHECGEWPTALAVGRRVLQLIARDSTGPARAVVHFDSDVDRRLSRATNPGRAFPDVRSFLKSLTAQR